MPVACVKPPARSGDPDSKSGSVGPQLLCLACRGNCRVARKLSKGGPLTATLKLDSRHLSIRGFLRVVCAQDCPTP